MRVFTVVLALAATPFLVSAAQDRGQAAAAVSADGKCQVADLNRSPNSTPKVQMPLDKKGRDRRGCSPVRPAPTEVITPPEPPPPATGSVGISGMVFNVLDWSGLPGFVVEIRGPVSLSAVTDEAGVYAFSQLPAGIYLICEVLQGSWIQSIPSEGASCPTGVGYQFTLADGESAAFVDFGNMWW